MKKEDLTIADLKAIYNHAKFKANVLGEEEFNTITHQADKLLIKRIKEIFI